LGVFLKKKKFVKLENGVLSMTDVVWNHTAVDSDWIKDHPEGTYNLNNTPHLRLAYEVDRALLALSVCIAKQEFKLTIPPSPKTDGSSSVIAFETTTTTLHSSFPPVDVLVICLFFLSV
jgi:hypothetical protein